MAPHGHRVQAFVCGDRADLCRRQASGVNIRGGAASLQVPGRVIQGKHPLVAAVGTRTCAATHRGQSRFWSLHFIIALLCTKRVPILIIRPHH